MVALAPDRPEQVLSFELRGGHRELFAARDPEILCESAAGSGKTRAILELFNILCHTYSGLRCLMVRKTQVSMTTSCLAEFKKHVLTPADNVVFFGGSKSEAAAFNYPNGSTIVVGGMDNPEKILSSFYDLVYVNEATELSLEDWETLTGRIRGADAAHEPRKADGTPFTARRIIGDCNPTYERHWLMQRTIEGKTRLIRSTRLDNPAYYRADGTPTPVGAEYEARLDNMSGQRYQRFKLGIRIGVENAIYPQLDASKHLVEIPQNTAWAGHGTTGVDFGRIHLSAVVTITLATDGVWWVRECWAEAGGNLQAIEEACRSHRLRFKTRGGVVDPVQEVLGQRLGYKVAKSGAGSRKGRIEAVTKLLDAGALKFDVYGEGVRELFDEAVMYRFEIRETNTLIEDVVVRKDDDRIAALEYAIEAAEVGLGTGGQVFSYA